MAISIGNVELHKKFWGNLSRFSNTYALSQFWLVGFPVSYINQINTIIQDNFSNYEPQWNLNSSWISFDERWFVGGTYFLIARGIQLPGDAIEVQRTGVSQSGNIKGLIGIQRTDLPIVNITFMETNQSFVDCFLRPWCILTGHMSLKQFDLRMADISLDCFQKRVVGGDLELRKSIILQQAVPVSIDTEELNYTGDKIIDRQIQFAYTKYILDAPKATDDESTESFQVTIQDQASKEQLVELKKAPSSLIPNIERGPIEIVEGLLSKTESIYNNVQGKLGRIDTAAMSIANLIPGRTGKDIRNTISQTFDNTQKITTPVANIISTGNKITQGSREVINVSREATTMGNPQTQSQVPEANKSEKK